MNRMKIATLAFGAAILGGAGFLLNGLPTVAQASDMTVYKSDSCGCCGGCFRCVPASTWMWTGPVWNIIFTAVWLPVPGWWTGRSMMR